MMPTPGARPPPSPACLQLPALVLEVGGHLVPALHSWLAGMLGTATSWLGQTAFTMAAMLGPERVFHRLGWPTLTHRLDSTGTPTTVVGGAVIVGAVALAELEQLVRAARDRN